MTCACPWAHQVHPRGHWHVTLGTASTLLLRGHSHVHSPVCRSRWGLDGVSLGLTVVCAAQVHRTQWGSNPLARGSYSYPAAATQHGDQDRYISIQLFLVLSSPAIPVLGTLPAYWVSVAPPVPTFKQAVRTGCLCTVPGKM